MNQALQIGMGLDSRSHYTGALAATRSKIPGSPQFGEEENQMLDAYRLEKHRLARIEPEDLPTSLKESIWVQLIEPTPEELEMVQSLYHFPFPSIDEIEELEAASHYAVYEEALQFNTLFLHKVGGRPRNTNVAIIICEKRVICVCAREIPAFRLLRMRANHDPTLLSDPESIVVNLMEIKVDELADILEEAGRELERLSTHVLGRLEADFRQSIDQLADIEDLNGKVRICLMDGQRDLGFLLRRGRLDEEYAEGIRDMLRDVETLLPHNTYLTEKVDFVLNAAMGFINIEQNQIIKIFSIAAVVFLPPTLVASIYGMNFRFMPELAWHWSYPVAIAVMVVSAITPYLLFKHKGWL